MLLDLGSNRTEIEKQNKGEGEQERRIERLRDGV